MAPASLVPTYSNNRGDFSRMCDSPVEGFSAYINLSMPDLSMMIVRVR